MHVYILKHAFEPRFKIGKANDPSARSNQIGKSNDLDFGRISAFNFGDESLAFQIEKNLHALFSPWRLAPEESWGNGRTEWFDVSALPAAHSTLTLLEGLAQPARYAKGLTKRPDGEAPSGLDCLGHLLNRRIKTSCREFSCRELVVEATVKRKAPSRTAILEPQRLLEELGLKSKTGSDGQILLFIANRHDQLSKFWTGTAWTKTYAQQLHRIEGVEKSDSVIRLCGRSTKGRWIPTGIFQNPEI